MDWLTGNLRLVLQAPLAQVALALVALLCGGIIGSERERKEKAAGLRTLILVSLGSAGFTMVGFAFAANNGDAGRVAAQIVTGIGFLGAGVILHPRGTISGATTAASIWLTASVGMIAGAGYAGAAVGMSVLVRLILAGVTVYEGRMFAMGQLIVAELEYEPANGRTRIRIERILSDYAAASFKPEWKSGAEGLDRLTLEVRLPTHHAHILLDDLVSIPEIRKIRKDCVEAEEQPQK